MDAIGFQKEAVHTGALRHLLDGPHAVDVARSLTGDRKISAVDHARAEVRLRKGSRRPVDLAAELKLGPEAAIRLAIEVKVDSAWTPGQLRDAVPRDARGLLLALGYTALAVSKSDMDAIDGYRWPWRSVGPDELAAVVRSSADGDRELIGYARHLEREADDHKNARQAVRAGRRVTWGRRRLLLEHWAYFGEVIRHRNDAALWERKSLVSGPLMTLWVVDHRDGTRDYLEFMGQGADRSLCVKTWAEEGSGLLSGSRDRLSAALEGLAGESTRKPAGSAKTCTVAKFPLDGVKPRKAADLVETLVARLDS